MRLGMAANDCIFLIVQSSLFCAITFVMAILLLMSQTLLYKHVKIVDFLSIKHNAPSFVKICLSVRKIIGGIFFDCNKERSYRKVDVDNRSIFDTIYEPEAIKMNIATDIKPVTYLKSRAADLLNQINETHRPVIITQNGEPRAVLQDTASYENMRNAIGLLKLISQGESDVRNGRVRLQSEVFNGIENSLKEKL